MNTTTDLLRPDYHVAECGIHGCDRLARYDGLCARHLAVSRRRWMAEHRHLEARLAHCTCTHNDGHDRGGR